MNFDGTTASTEIEKFDNGISLNRTDALAIEEPLEIRLEFCDINKKTVQKSISLTMRTPGHDFDLALGFLLTEGILEPAERKEKQISGVSFCGPAQAHLGHSNVVKVKLNDTVKVNLKSLERNFYTTSSCGVCGKASIEALRLKTPTEFLKLRDKPFQLSKALIPTLPHKLRDGQKVFKSTGGLHASGIFDSFGELKVLREDVGRHNAVDKVIGWAFDSRQLPLSQSALVLSGRISFELVQKAAMAGIPMIIAVGAPSSLALQLAQDAHITLVGFVRENRFNVYNDEGRLK